MRGGYAALGLYMPKTDLNVGGAMRAAFCYGAAMVAIQGRRFKRMPTDTQYAWRHIPVIECDDLRDIIPFDCIPVVIEIADKARTLPSYCHPERAFYIFGPEDGSVPNDIIERFKNVVSVPTRHCMNLAATVNVVLYDRLAKQGLK